MYFYRFMSLDHSSFVPAIQAYGLAAWKKRYQELMSDMNQLSSAIASHYAGAGGGQSLFISLTTDYQAASKTTDNSFGGLAGIVKLAPFLGRWTDLKPRITPEKDNSLQSREGEVLWFPDPGDSLKNYPYAIFPNPYGDQVEQVSKLMQERMGGLIFRFEPNQSK